MWTDLFVCAVTYFAGLVGYFFRGRLITEEITPVDETVTFEVENVLGPTRSHV